MYTFSNLGSIFLKMIIRFLFVFLMFFITSASLNAEEGNKDILFYTGQFDIKDDVGDDETSLFGVEHKNSNLFRNTFLGKFSPVTGAFVTGKGSTYVYTGVEAQYNLGPIKILPSFTPGYYEKGDGKNLGDVLEFKSELKLILGFIATVELSPPISMYQSSPKKFALS